MPKNTDDTIKEYTEDLDISPTIANAIVMSAVSNHDLFGANGLETADNVLHNHGYKGYFDYYEANPNRAERNFRSNLTRLTNKIEKSNIPSRFIVGSKFYSSYIQSFENDFYYIPDSDYCFIRCLENINKVKIDRKGLNPYGDSLQSLRTIMNNYKIKPDIMKLINNDGVFKMQTLNKKACTSDYKILLMPVKECHYHAILIKRIPNIKTNDFINEIIDKINIVDSLELSDDQLKIKPIQYKPKKRYLCCYDIETSSLRFYYDSSKNEITKEEFLKLKNGREEKHQVPEGVAYILLDLEKKEIIEQKQFYGENCYNDFVDYIAKLELNEELTVIAHNGGRFDNIYVKTCSNYKIIRQSKKGGIKKLTIEDENKKRLHFIDSFAFLQASLEKSAEYFDIGTNKIKFDIVNKDHEFFVTNEEWKPYMIQDTLVLAKICLKLEEYISMFGESITNNIGIPSIAWKLLNKNCHNFKKITRTKDPSTLKFFSDARYGGRIIHKKKAFKAIDDYLICLDGNSLFPSAMALFKYPIGSYSVMTEDDINNFESDFLNKHHYIVEIELNTNNSRHPLLPSRNEDGTIIYKSGIVRGVYTSVDIEEAINDGYSIVEVYRGTYWNQEEFIYSKIINYLYDLRKKLKKEKNPMEYLLKILLNSAYGYHSLSINSSNRFSYDDKIKSKGDVMTMEKLPNGQNEFLVSHNDVCDKPIHLAAFILSYSRKIMNNLIRLIGPDYIWYGDTDSIYISYNRYKELEKAGLINLSGDLGGYKNDYGDGEYITEAIFLDIKRYLLKFNDGSYKAKFNGLNFKDGDSLINWQTGKDETEYDLLKKMYDWFNENPGELSKISIIQDKWHRLNTEVIISKEELTFQVDPNSRAIWIFNDSFPLDFDNTLYEDADKKIKKVTYLGKQTTYPEFEQSKDYCLTNGSWISTHPVKYAKKIGLKPSKLFTSFVYSVKTKQMYYRRVGKDEEIEYFIYNGITYTDKIELETIEPIQDIIYVKNDNSNNLIFSCEINEADSKHVLFNIDSLLSNIEKKEKELIKTKNELLEMKKIINQ